MRRRLNPRRQKAHLLSAHAGLERAIHMDESYLSRPALLFLPSLGKRMASYSHPLLLKYSHGITAESTISPSASG